MDEAATVGRQDDLDEVGGIVGGCAFDVILVAFVEDGKVEFVIDLMAQGMLEAAGDDFPAKSTGSCFRPLCMGLNRAMLLPLFALSMVQIMTECVAGFIGILEFFYSLNVEITSRPAFGQSG